MDPIQAKQAYNTASDLYRQKRYPEALAILDQLERAFPNQRQIIYSKALVLAATGSSGDALRLCDRLIKLGDERGAKLKSSLTPLAMDPGWSQAAGSICWFEKKSTLAIAVAILVCLVAAGAAYYFLKGSGSARPAGRDRVVQTKAAFRKQPQQVLSAVVPKASRAESAATPVNTADPVSTPDSTSPETDRAISPAGQDTESVARVNAALEQEEQIRDAPTREMGKTTDFAPLLDRMKTLVAENPGMVKVSRNFCEAVKSNNRPRVEELVSKHPLLVNCLLFGEAGSPEFIPTGAALFYAVQGGYLDIVKFLVEHGANVNAETDSMGGTPLHTACAFGKADVAKFLLEKGADLNKRRNNGSGNTPLYEAVQYPELVKLLIEYKPDLTPKCYEGRTALEQAVFCNSAESARLIREAEKQPLAKKP